MAAAPLPRGYRSVTEYRFREDQADAIVRAAAYHRKDYCHSVIWFSPREHVGIRTSIATPFPRTPNTGLGSLNRLPLELLHDILLRLDIQSFLTFGKQISVRDRRRILSINTRWWFRTDSSFSAPCYEHDLPPTFLCSTFTMRCVSRLALSAANLPGLYPS